MPVGGFVPIFQYLILWNWSDFQRFWHRYFATKSSEYIRNEVQIDQPNFYLSWENGSTMVIKPFFSLKLVQVREMHVA